MAGLKTVLENLDELPDALKEFYTEKDGKHVLEVDDIDNHPAVTGLKNALAAQKQARAKQAEELQKLKDRLAKIPEDFDPDEVIALRAKIEEYEADPAKRTPAGDKERQEAVAARKMLEQKIASLEKTSAAEIKKRDDEIKKKSDFIGQLLIDEGLTKALVNAGVGKEFIKATKAMLRDSVKVVEDAGDYSAVVETDTGPLDIERFVSDWIASDEGKVFVPPAKGGDAGGSGKPSKPAINEKNPWAKETWNLTEQGKLMRADRVKAEKFAKAAGHKLPEIPASAA